ncbi:MAG: hypothetical protein ACYC8T_25040 [Myxococcaceae bacterium]
MPINVRYTTRAALDWAEVVTCPHCGLKSRAGIAVVGVGSSKATLGIGRDEARERAGIGAFADAVGSAKSMIQRARCPKCGKRGGGVAWLICKTFLLCTFAAGLVLHWTGHDRFIGHTFVAVLLLVAGIVWLRLRASDARVRFEPVLEPDQRPEKEPFVPAHLRLDPAEPPQAATPAPRWPADPEGASSPKEQLGPGEDSELALDLDRSWNKKKGT